MFCFMKGTVQISNHSVLLIITSTLYLIFNIDIYCISTVPHQMMVSQVSALARDWVYNISGWKIMLGLKKGRTPFSVLAKKTMT